MNIRSVMEELASRGHEVVYHIIQVYTELYKNTELHAFFILLNLVIACFVLLANLLISDLSTSKTCKSGDFEKKTIKTFFNIASYYLNCLAISRLSDSP